MAHYAFLDENNIVTEVITGKDETETIDGLTPEQWYENYRGLKCVRTSYWTATGKHFNNGVPFRKNYASIGSIYDPIRDAFYAPQPYPSWVLNEETCQWQAPTPHPTDDKFYVWDEATYEWVCINEAHTTKE